MEIQDIRRLQIKPGDRLVLRLNSHLTQEQVGIVREHLERFAPGVPVLVLDPGMDLEVVAGGSS